ncbi:hypothetical protein BGW36DRAFT_303446 [Talaromyces proteolyticus]|uniref:ATP-dependent DNA ligase family profile domain-containing protein n=1 Tax=Talaromyces proteolyticus TaxID=1131652 RepID=A0AAD4PVW7_9EURO|nr:uncharacterized protein BGW36DRAFT_303446 [Talaromyces proteolyticus]KAH8691873.1 hypothetical protein BGW36DRAFT_303446 [Talaromyces proteolyticus]
MPFPFSELCVLFNALDQARERKTSAHLESININNEITTDWFKRNREMIPQIGSEAVSFLSCLLPERRVDRVFDLRERRLAKLIQEAQCLGNTRFQDLQAWKTAEGPDFASCVENIMIATDAAPRSGPSVTLEEIDQTLDQIAGYSSFSSAHLSASINGKETRSAQKYQRLVSIFRRLHSSEAKWMVRMILKNYNPIPERQAILQFHFLLPDILRVQKSLEAAVKVLSIPMIRSLPVQPSKRDTHQLRQSKISNLLPEAGIMVERPEYQKARSISHCCKLAGSRLLSIERKYDGEYCQVHIDRSRGQDCIKIFSKSGRDSTDDRIGLHKALRQSLKLDSADCSFKERCIVEGELLVWNDTDQKIAPFHRIRNHVTRGGYFLGTARDLPARDDEHLMIMFYDILLLDHIVCMYEPDIQRRQRLQSLVHCIAGRADIGNRHRIDFSFLTAEKRLQQILARAITQRWEGLVLKGCYDSYLPLYRTFRPIKLKKDYIPGLGDSIDFAVVGGWRDATDEQALGIGSLRWTSFYIACLDNKEEVYGFKAKPKFRSIDIVDRHGISKHNLVFLNRRGYLELETFTTSLPQMDVNMGELQRSEGPEIFRHPFIVEVIGAGFDKPPNASYLALRFPRIQKIHDDRTFTDVVGYNELQTLAKQAIDVPDDESDEEEIWTRKLQPSAFT